MDSSRIVNTYAADGTKLRSVYKTNAATLMFPLGHQCEQEHIDYLERTVDYCGSVRYEHDGTYQNTIVYNTEGYYSQADSAFFAYQKDYQGNIAQVWNVKTGQLVQLNEYFPDGTPTPRTIGEETQPYKYNGNEWVRFNGNDAYDFNARQFQPTLLRFDRPDPLAEKYYDVSPYAFCGGNMVRFTDPTGEDWKISTQTDENEITHVNITITGVVYNNSSYKDINLNNLASTIKSQIESVWTFDTDKYEVNTTANIRVAESADDVTETDHVFQIVDNKRFEKESTAADAAVFGLDIRIKPSTARMTISGENNRTIAHELGHTGGLRHPASKKNPIYIRSTSNNLMTQTGRIADPKNSVNIENDQIQSVIDSYQNKKLNQREFSPLRTLYRLNIGEYKFFPYKKIITPNALRKR